MIAPHGGTLINRMVEGAERDALLAKAADLPQFPLNSREASDLEMIAIGAFSPLTGFVGPDDFRSICTSMRMADGTPWPIPITLAVDDEVKATLTEGGRAALMHGDGTLMAVIDVNSIYEHDTALELPSVFRTEDAAHPGVQAVLDEGHWLVGGPIHVLTVTPEREPGEQFTEHRLTPAETRAAFAAA